MNCRGGGTIWKYKARNGKRLWRYQFDGEPVEGKRCRFTRAGFCTRTEALNALYGATKSYDDNKTRPIATAQHQETVSDWIQTWLRVYAPERCQPKTLERYIGLANYIVKATEGEPAKLAVAPLDQIDHKIVESALRSLLHAKAKRREHLSPKTIREIAGVLSVSLNEAFRLEKIAINPLLRVKLPKIVRSDARSLTSEEIQRLREVCRADWTFTIVELALATGARRGELLSLTWHDVDWLNSTLTVNKSLEETRVGLRVKSPKNGRSRRFAVGQSVIAALQFLQAQQAEHRRLCGAGYQELDLVLCKPNGEYLHPDLVSQVICRRMKKAGIRDASLHTLRHTHASNLLSRGIPLPAVSQRLGHADANITARVYSHALPQDDARAADAWEKVIRGPIQ